MLPILLGNSPVSATTMLGIFFCLAIGYLAREMVSIMRQYPGRVARERRVWLERRMANLEAEAENARAH